MATKLKNIKYSWLSKSGSIISLWIIGFVFIISGIISSSTHYYDFYETYESSFIFQETIAKELIKVVEESDIFESNQLKKKLIVDDSESNLLFYVSNKTTGSYVTNAKDKRINGIYEGNKGYEYRMNFTSGNGIYYRMIYMVDEDNQSLNNIMTGIDYEISIAVKNGYPVNDAIRKSRDDYATLKNGVGISKYVFSIFAVMLLFNLIYIGFFSVCKEEKDVISTRLIDKISLELMVLFVIFVMIMSRSVLTYEFVFSRSNVLQLLILLIEYHEIITRVSYSTLAAIVISYTVYFAMSLIIFTSCIRRIKHKTFFRNLIGYKVIKGLEPFFKKKIIGTFKMLKNIVTILSKKYNQSIKHVSYVYRLLFKGIGCLFLNIFVMFMILYSEGHLGYFLLLVVADIVYIFKIVAEIGGVLDKVRHLSMGNYKVFEDIRSKDGEFAEIYENLIKINDTIENSVEKALKNERTKTALITNVSHDLKTPLTSIITYVDLLKNEDLDNDKAREYIQVLEAKSEKLRYLIENLIEVSKTSTGNVDVNLQVINVMELLNQSIGEYETKINDAGLDVITNVETKNLFIHADGNIMWRIFDNLFSNISKYSLPNSRVYVSVMENENDVILVMKNISKNQLNIPSDKLLERFVRGDESRSSEGYGLGLSITSDLVLVQGGDFTIDIDGDLFKTTIRMDKSEKNMIKETVAIDMIK